MVQNRQKDKVNNPLTLSRNLAIFGILILWDFGNLAILKKYTSKEVETKLKRFLRPNESFLRILKKSQKWSKIVKKLRLTPLLFGDI